MAHEIRLVRSERRDVVSREFAAPRVRIRVVPLASPAPRERRAASAPTNLDPMPDGLLAARGILFAALLSVAAWAVIGLVVWVIVR